MPFNEICIYQVKHQKTDVFETLMLEAYDKIKHELSGCLREKTVY